MTFDQTWYAVGTASVSNGSTTVTGQSSNWLSGGIIAGDYFLAAGELVPIQTVNSNTSITLTDGWPGATRATDSYKIIPASDAVRILTATRAVLSLLLNGNVQALSGLTLAANKGLYATGAGSLATHDQTAFGRAIQGLTGANGGFIRATAAGAAVMQAILGTVTQSGGVPTGAIVERGINANGEYVRFADGTQICMRTLPGTTHATATSANGINRTDPFSLPLPAAFAAIPYGFMSIAPGNGWLGTIAATSTTQWQYQLLINVAQPTPIATSAMSFLAVGRWF